VSLKDRLATASHYARGGDIARRFGVLENPFPASNQTTNNPHFPLPSDDEIDARVESFVRDKRSQVIVILGTQGIGKTNVLNHYERVLKRELDEIGGFYVVRYLADPEASFDSTLRRLFQELGVEHLMKLGKLLNEGDTDTALEQARGHEVRVALRKLAQSDGDEVVATALNEWFMGIRLLKHHREVLGVNFRLDTVESKTAAFRDLVLVSSAAKLLNGIFLLLDEIEKQDGVLSATGVNRYLSSLRAIMDALPNHLFMMIAMTPDALRRYSLAVPAFRSRLENRIGLLPIDSLDEAINLANFYIDDARHKAEQEADTKSGDFEPLVSHDQIMATFAASMDRARKRGDSGVNQREYLHNLHLLAESAIQRAQKER